MSVVSLLGQIRLPRRFDTLRFKFFVAIAGANALLAALAFVVFSWSFDQGFVEYLNRADESRLQPLIAKLGESFRSEGDWLWVTADRRRWGEVLREVMGAGRGPGPRRFDEGSGPPLDRPERPERGEPPPADPMLTIDPRLLLFDERQHLLAGRPEMVPEAILKPIAVDGRNVGYLGYVPRLKMVTSLERLFSAQQTNKFAAIAIGMLIAGLAIAALLANWLSLRIRRLAQGAEALIQGNYGMRVQSHGHDELAVLADDFNQLAQTLEAAQQARQQWIADIAHELRTPLAILRAEIEALQDGIRPLGAQSLGSLAQEVARLTRLVEDLRTLSLSDLGALTYYKEKLDLGDIVADVISSHGIALGERDLTVTSRLSEVSVVGDGTRLTQVFNNLMQNTLRYTQAHGQLAVELIAGDAPHQAVVVWEDSSPGVAEADLPRLTDRLFRVEGSRSSSGGGSGLGLAIAKAIVEAHGGSMTPSPSPLGGLRWTLTFSRDT